MKRLPLAYLLVFLSSFVLVSCGKSPQQKQMESDLSKRVMQLHDSGMVKMRQTQQLGYQLDSTLTLHDSLAAAYPREAANHSRDDIPRAKENLATAQGAMHAWMAAHTPYDPEMKHDEAMARLNADFQKLTNVSAQLDTAIVDAIGVIENHRKFAAELLAKKPMKKGRK